MDRGRSTGGCVDAAIFVGEDALMGLERTRGDWSNSHVDSGSVSNDDVAKG